VAALILTMAGGVWSTMALSQEQQHVDFSKFVWPEEYGQEDRTTALEELLADRESDLARISEDIKRFPAESSEAAALREKASALEDYIASLKAFLAEQA
jgi:hypothetical protein